MKILITGAAGFIGYHLAKQLVERGEEVIGLDNISNYYDINLKYDRLQASGIENAQLKENHLVQSNSHPNYHFIKLGIEDYENLSALFKREKFDIVCNLAAQAGVRHSIENPHAYVESNIVGFVNVLECCRHFKIKHLVYASSSSVYGLNKKMPLSTSDTAAHPVSLYAASKKSNELMAHAYSHLFKLPTTGVRFFTVYGPWGRPDMAYFLFTEAILKNKPIKIFNHGKMFRDFTYINDIVEGIVKIMDTPAAASNQWNDLMPNPSISKAPYTIYNIGKSNPIKLMDFINILEEALGKKAKKTMLPMQPGDVLATYADVTDLVEKLDYKPDTDLSTGIQKFVDWYLQYYNIDVLMEDTSPVPRLVQQESR